MEDILKKYKDAAKTHGEASSEGKHRIANKQYSILSNIYRDFEADTEKAKNILDSLMDNDNIHIKAWAAAHALGLNICTKKAEKLLIILSKQNNIGIARLNSEMTLKVWREGKLKF